MEMKMKMKKRARARRQRLSSPLPDEIMVEVLSRVPIKSLLRCQSVSKDWFRLINSCPPLKHILVMLKVLPRLPVKSLLQFRSVSRTWLNLISLLRFDPSYKKVRDVFPTPNQFVIVCFNTIVPKPSVRLQVIDLFDGQLHSEFRLTDCYENYWYAGSSHGLVYISDYMAEHIYVCNPSTHEQVKLPVPPYASFRHTYEGAGILDKVVIGMGFLPDSNTYKFVVWFPHDHDGSDCNPPSGFEIFTLKDGCDPRSCQWRLVKSHVNLAKPPQAFHNSSRGVYAMGGIYWILRSTSSVGMLGGWTVLAFDLTTEEERIIQPPATWYYRHDCITKIVELRGSMCVVETGFLVSGTVIWVLRDGDKWDPPCIIRQTLQGLLACVPDRTRHSASAFAGKQEEEDLNLVLMLASPRLGYYSIKNKSISVSSEGSWVARQNAKEFVYADTLFSLKSHASRRAKAG